MAPLQSTGYEVHALLKRFSLSPFIAKNTYTSISRVTRVCFAEITQPFITLLPSHFDLVILLSAFLYGEYGYQMDSLPDARLYHSGYNLNLEIKRLTLRCIEGHGIWRKYCFEFYLYS
jgi:hypothetical protein